MAEMKATPGSAALKSHARVYCVSVFDSAILERLPSRPDRRVEFIWESVRELQLALRAAAAQGRG